MDDIVSAEKDFDSLESGNGDPFDEVSKPVAPAAPVTPVKAPTPPAHVELAPLVFDDSEMSGEGIVVGDVGIEVSRFPVDRARFSGDSKNLMSIVTDKVVAVSTHYRDGVGAYLCVNKSSGGKCCQKDGLPRIKYIFPVAIYDTDGKGKPRSPDMKFKVLSVGKEQYEAIMTIAELNGRLSTLDVLFLCSDEKYQKGTFQYAGPARYRQSAKTAAKVREFWEAHMKDVILPVASRIPWEILEKKGQEQTVETEGKVTMEAVFKDD